VIVRLLNVLGLLALLAAAGIAALCVRQWSSPCDDNVTPREGVSLAERASRIIQSQSIREPEEVSVLVAQAQAFVACLRPPAPPAPPKPAPAPKDIPVAIAPAPVPIEESPKFVVLGTSCSESHPERSMALVAESGKDPEARWVRQGAVIGHFVVREIRAADVLCSLGDKSCSMPVQRLILPPVVASANPADKLRTAANGPMAKNPSEAPPRRPGASSGPRVGSTRTTTVE
jgi:hypothetical protein